MVADIVEFQDKNRWLSNFWPVRFVWRGKEWSSVEQAYQSAKFEREDLVEYVRRAESPGEAKRRARSRSDFVRADWLALRDGVMLELLRLKFEDAELRAKLIATGDAKIVEGQNWHDTHFGVCMCPKHKGEGENVLGKLLMQVRGEVRGDGRGV